MSDVSSALEKLATYRSHNTRASQETVEKGSLILKSSVNISKRLGDEGWSFLEQLALAAVDVGRIDVADQCLQQLSDKFPGSPRVEILAGIRIEATEKPEIALRYYDSLLEADSANAAAWKRRISVLRRTGKVEKAAEELAEFLDTFYNDVEGWLELADIYTSCNQYTHALQALSHLLLINPQNPFYVLQYAETAYTAGDLPLSLKMFLLVVDMWERDDPEPVLENAPVGIAIRAWYGIKLCTSRLLLSSDLPSASRTSVPKKLNLIDELATERLLTAYKGSARDARAKDVVYRWVGAS